MQCIVCATGQHSTVRAESSALLVPSVQPCTCLACIIVICLGAALLPLFRSVGIVQQMQIKKARKLQEDIRAEEEKLQLTHLARLRRAAAAEVAGDAAAKATTLGWLHGGVRGREADEVEHSVVLLQAVLELQEAKWQQQQQQGDAGRQQQQVAEASNKQEKAAAAAAAADVKRDAAAESKGGAPAAAEGGADVMQWIKQPENHHHHLRVALECLKELGAADIPARDLVSRKVRASLWCR